MENKCLDNFVYKPYIDLLFDFRSKLLIENEKKLSIKALFSKIINSRQLFFRFGKKLMSVDTSHILDSYVFLKKQLKRKENN